MIKKLNWKILANVPFAPALNLKEEKEAFEILFNLHQTSRLF
ncbi:hypothetical protein PCC7821_05118 (plasmid) [Planktothrix rubescens NIVA-CYA 18]|nr:hypothetical protein PCC7821_05118 [Planktothrix rubescens NIVA-CYA 18]